ncbi:MAG: hypothetical protein RL538_93 [Candidatus Parcubacteria bacterium]|jgi:hypothetical protein
MTKNPFYNAAAALMYVVFVVSIIRFLEIFASDKPDNEFLAPVAMLSLLVLSASTMAYIFFYQPTLMLFQNEQKKALDLFLKTVGIFAAFTAIVFVVMLFTLP